MATLTTGTRKMDPDTYARILEAADEAAVAFTRTPAQVAVRAAQDAQRKAARKAADKAAAQRRKAQRAAAAADKAACGVVTIEWLDALELAVRNMGGTC